MPASSVNPIAATAIPRCHSGAFTSLAKRSSAGPRDEVFGTATGAAIVAAMGTDAAEIALGASATPLDAAFRAGNFLSAIVCSAGAIWVLARWGPAAAAIALGAPAPPLDASFREGNFLRSIVCSAGGIWVLARLAWLATVWSAYSCAAVPATSAGGCPGLFRWSAAQAD